MNRLEENIVPERARAQVGMVCHMVATVDGKGRPRSLIRHPVWEWYGKTSIGWSGTRPTQIKRAHFEASPFVSLKSWSSSHDTCPGEFRATWASDDETRTWEWNLIANGPDPAGDGLAIMPDRNGSKSDALAVLRVDPWRLRIFLGTVLPGQDGSVLNRQA